MSFEQDVREVFGDNKVPSYGMFSDLGNSLVAEIVKGAKYKNLTWSEVDEMLRTISTIKGCEEATDTAVREAVYIELGY